MNLLITGAWQEAKKHIKTIEDMGHKVFFLQWEQDPLPCKAELIEGIIASNIFQHHPIEAFTNLRYFQATSAGLDRQPMDYLETHNITVRNARGVSSIPMAEYAVGGVLTFYKKQRCFLNNQSKHIWEKQRDLCELYGKTVCIVGCGSVGTECAKRFQAFGCHVLGIDTPAFAKTISMEKKQLAYYENVLSIDMLGDIIPTVDILILSIPLTNETRHLLDADMMNQLKPGCILVNISRGAVVDQEAMIHVLKDSNKSIQAVLDVFEEEPLPPDNPLWGMENVLITPHNSFVGEGNHDRLSRLILQNLMHCD